MNNRNKRQLLYFYQQQFGLTNHGISAQQKALDVRRRLQPFMMVRLLLILISLSLCSCNSRLRERTHSFGMLDVRIYSLSEITNSYQYVDVGKNGDFETIFRSNDLSVDSILFRRDSLIIRTYPGTPLYIHQKVKFGVNIIIDSTTDPYRRFREKKYF